MNKIIYLDAAASYQKPETVVQAEMDFLTHNYANAGRGICARASHVDYLIEDSRRSVANFIGAAANQIVFTSGTTDSINKIVGMLNLNPDCVVAVSDLDHHSARLPFMMSDAKIVVCPLDKQLNIDIDNIPYADVFVITAMSNVVGLQQDVCEIIKRAKTKNPNVITVVDAAQSVVHSEIDVVKWNCDFLCFSGHKIGADTGVGIMYIKNPENYGPVFFGGGMVNKIMGDKIIFNSSPDVFEAGTLPLTQIVGLKPAIEGIKKNRPDLNLIKYMYDELSQIDKIKIISARDSALLSFVVDGMHVLDFGALIAAHNVCLRVGNMCASWIHQLLGCDGSIRISVGAYNTLQEIQTVVKYIKEIIK
ncbi:MAG: aminotransferase class V-fold PLP-dependent enzyme [Alphaproteobacteria bacterium]|nr:aminotransferase class V-fold PLP-dependent enzyme [Alphaproteobacteria bacterium]